MRRRDADSVGAYKDVTERSAWTHPSYGIARGEVRGPGKATPKLSTMSGGLRARQWIGNIVNDEVALHLKWFTLGGSSVCCS